MQGHHNHILNAGHSTIKAHKDYIGPDANQIKKVLLFCVTLYIYINIRYTKLKVLLISLLRIMHRWSFKKPEGKLSIYST